MDAISQRLEEIYKRLELIDADSAESRAASILAVGLLVYHNLLIIKVAYWKVLLFCIDTLELVEFRIVTLFSC